MEEWTTYNPTTGDAIERFTRMTPETIDRAFDDAVEAARLWRTSTHDDRAGLLRAIARELHSAQEPLAATAVREMGKPIGQARAEVEKCAWCCEYFAEHAAAMLEPQPSQSNGSNAFIAFRPLGVLFAIMPWNFPYWQVVRAVAPAIAAGNTVLLKHADNTTRCGLELDAIVQRAGAPEGLFRTLLIDHEAADTAIGDPRIAAVTLTGSERAGIAVGAAAGAALKPSVLELGGSDPFIVLADADLDLAVEYAVKARFQNNGQSCIAAKRFIVEDRVYERFVAHFAQSAAALRVGDPMDDRTQLGPCARADLRETLHRLVTQTVVDGGRIVTGGRDVDGAGFFYEPTVVADVAPGTPLWNEESFGPAAAVTRAADDDDAIQLANQTAFGLGANIWTRDTDHAVRMAAQLDAGMVFINGMVASDPRLPFGGVKRSGYGRELSPFGLHAFVNIQTVWIGPQRD